VENHVKIIKAKCEPATFDAAGQVKEGDYLRHQLRYNPEPLKTATASSLNLWLSKVYEQTMQSRNPTNQQTPRPRKPHAGKNKSEEEFKARLVEWEATLPHGREVKVKGDSIT